MKIVIAGAAGNLGTALARHWLDSPHELRLLVHRKEPAEDVQQGKRIEIVRADLGDPASLRGICAGADCVVHLAGVLFAPRPERFLPRTNVGFVRNLAEASRAESMRKFLLLSFPHVEGNTTPDHPARGIIGAAPPLSVHARTRLEAEKKLIEICAGSTMTPLILRAGVVYGRGVKLIEAARWLLRRRLMAIWRRPTWVHLIALPDLFRAVDAALTNDRAEGIYNICDDAPLLLGDFLDRLAEHWGFARPLRLPEWTFHSSAVACEIAATLLRVPAPLTRDIIHLAMVSSVADTSRVKEELLPNLQYPSFQEGLELV